MRHAKKRPNRSLRIEGLESRQLMAGDVAVGFADGMLTIAGDGQDNGVMVEQVGPESYRVDGMAVGGAETLINGKDGYFVARGVKSIQASLGKGNDSFLLNGMGSSNGMLANDLTLDTGYGNDTAVIIDFWAVGDIGIVTDPIGDKTPGRDELYVHDTVAYGFFDAAMGAGADTLMFSVTEYGWNAAHEGYRLDTGAGTVEGDYAKLDHLFTWKSLDITLSEGRDQLIGGNLLAYEGHVTVRAAGGDDDITIADSNMDWQLTEFNTSVIVDAGSGNDTVTLKNVTARGDVRVYGGSGGDDVNMYNVHARDRLYANLGSGDDSLYVEDSSAAVAYLYGSSHDKADTLHSVNNNFDLLFATGWEAGEW